MSAEQSSATRPKGSTGQLDMNPSSRTVQDAVGNGRAMFRGRAMCSGGLGGLCVGAGPCVGAGLCVGEGWAMCRGSAMGRGGLCVGYGYV